MSLPPGSRLPRILGSRSFCSARFSREVPRPSALPAWVGTGSGSRWLKGSCRERRAISSSIAALSVVHAHERHGHGNARSAFTLGENDAVAEPAAAAYALTRAAEPQAVEPLQC